MKLPDRFYDPMTAELMNELDAYAEIREAEIRRVANVLNSWPIGGVTGRMPARKPKLKSIRGVRA